MAKLVKIYVVDAKGNTLSGQKVHEYGGDVQFTDSKSYCVSLLLQGSKTTIFINGFTAYSGSVSNLGTQEMFTSAGRRP